MIYKIKVKSWEKYNGKTGKKDKTVCISNGFFNDAKIRMLTITGKCLYIGILLECGQNRRSNVDISHEDLVRFGGGSGVVVRRLLDRLQELQLVTYEILEVKNSSHKGPRKTKKTADEKNNVFPVYLSAQMPPEPKPITPKTPKKIVERGPIAELLGDKRIDAMLRDVTQETQKAWIDTFIGIDFVLEELKKANVWILANPKKAPRDFGRFFSNWLSRAHETYRKGLPSRRQTHSEMNAQVAQELWKKNEEGLL